MPDIKQSLSPGLLAGVLLRPFPAPTLNKILSLLQNRIIQQCPHLMDRLPDDLSGTVVISVTDLHLDLAFLLSSDHTGLQLASSADQENAIAKICGPLQRLIELLEGRVDGDALFFSRELRFEGDTEVVVALRNSLDGAEIRIADLLPLPPFMSGLRPAMTDGFSRLHQAFTRDMSMISDAITSQTERTARRQEKKIKKLEDRVSDLEKSKARNNRVVKREVKV